MSQPPLDPIVIPLVWVENLLAQWVEHEKSYPLDDERALYSLRVLQLCGDELREATGLPARPTTWGMP